MAGAKDVTEAAYNQFATFDRNIWEADGVAPFAQVYVNRTPQPSGVPLSTELKEALLHAKAPVKIFVTGHPLLQSYIDWLLDEQKRKQAAADPPKKE